MKTLALIFVLCLRSLASDWRDGQIFYYLNSGNNAGVALTASSIHNIDHVAAPFTGVNIGDQTGPLPSYCTTFVTDGVCGGSVPNCLWTRQYQNVTDDTTLFVTCRPVTLGITFIATNTFVGQPLWWRSNVDHTWHSAAIQFLFTGSDHLVTFGDGSTAWHGIFIFNGSVPVSGDSGSPVFTSVGDFAGSVSGIAGGGMGGIVRFSFPNGAQYRTATQTKIGLGALFNSDPDN